LEREIKPAILLILSGITLAMCLSTLTFSSVSAKNENLKFEISDCIVQGNSTHERSGPCPDADVEIGIEMSPSNNILEPEASLDKSPETKPADYTLPDFELIDPFGPLTE